MELGLYEAREVLLSLVTPLEHTTFVPLASALGRTTSKAIVCQKNLPSYNNAALDGFAFSFEGHPEELRIKATIYAGMVLSPVLEKGECYKIMTGAKVPEDADTIVAFEDTLGYDATHVTLPPSVKKGNAFRHKGEEQAFGSVLMEANTTLTPSHIAMLATQGITHVPVVTRPKVAIVSTGDELKEPWEQSGEDEIHNCNSYALVALLQSAGFEADYSGVIPDVLEESKRFIASLRTYDMVISSGGISMGEADFVRAGLEANGFEATFHGINIKPGRPTMVGRMGKTLVISLPGNPMAAFLNAFLLAIPALKKLAGMKSVTPPRLRATNTISFTCKGGRNELVLGWYEAGKFTVTRNNKYGSGMLTPLLESNAVLVSDVTEKQIDAGCEVSCVLLP
ncbi:MAG: molybdopterin molybdotransferase MoeA [Campylobacterales bacterium]|nr:molybdopterin molybdotransferase MoeA [Campylobacterales bacterium]